MYNSPVCHAQNYLSLLFSPIYKCFFRCTTQDNQRSSKKDLPAIQNFKRCFSHFVRCNIYGKVVRHYVTLTVSVQPRQCLIVSLNNNNFPKIITLYCKPLFRTIQIVTKTYIELLTEIICLRCRGNKMAAVLHFWLWLHNSQSCHIHHSAGQWYMYHSDITIPIKIATLRGKWFKRKLQTGRDCFPCSVINKE